jgi:hypothetical protein
MMHDPINIRMRKEKLLERFEVGMGSGLNCSFTPLEAKSTRITLG